MLIPEMTRADDPAITILDLQHRKTGKTHRLTGVVKQIVPFRLHAGDRGQTEPVIVEKCAL